MTQQKQTHTTLKQNKPHNPHKKQNPTTTACNSLKLHDRAYNNNNHHPTNTPEFKNPNSPANQPTTINPPPFLIKKHKPTFHVLSEFCFMQVRVVGLFGSLFLLCRIYTRCILQIPKPKNGQIKKPNP